MRVTKRVDNDVQTHIIRHDPARVFAEIVAKRHILEVHLASTSPAHRAGLEVSIRALAWVWRDLPDYDSSWGW